MFHTVFRPAVAASILFLKSAVPSAALTPEEVAKFKEAALHGPVFILMKICGIADDGHGHTYQRLALDGRVTCTLALRIIVDDIANRGHVGRTVCPAPGTQYGEIYEAVTAYFIAEKLDDEARPVDVALDALKRKYPCQPATRPK